jgi:1,4-dihydroxy-2-naphthoate octaprenyltransferase
MSGSAAGAVPVNPWLLATRPKTLPAAVTPVVVGTGVAIAAGGFHTGAAIAAFAVALLLQIAANLANDVFDFRRGADTEERLGPTRVTQSGLIPPQQVMIATAVTIALAMVAGLYLVYRGGWPILVLGIAAILSALAYTGGPLPIGYHGLGEVFVFIFFGLVAVAGTAYVQIGELTALAMAASVPVGLLATAILVVNNLRDIDTDRVAGKRTVAVRLGRERTIGEYTLLLAISYLSLPVIWLAGLSGFAVLLPVVTLPRAIKLVKSVSTVRGRALNPLLAGTAQLLLFFGLLLTVGIVVA